MCQRGLRANMQNACQRLIFMCQYANKRAKGVPIVQLACQRAKDMTIFQLRLPKGVPIFQLFF